MKALVIYDSVFGNTGKIAKAIGDRLQNDLQVETLGVNEATPGKVDGLDILIVGSPTRSFRPTEAVTKILNELTRKSLDGIQAAAFDTRIDLATIDSSVLRFVVDKGGYAAGTIARALQKKGAKLLAPPEGFLVTGEQGPLKEGEIERAMDWAKNLVFQSSQEREPDKE